jgi:hypothetical protein
MGLPRRHHLTAMIIALGLTSACDATGPGEQPASVQLSAPTPEVAVGTTVQITAVVLNSTGALIAGQQVQWTSLDPTIASVSPGGLVTALAAGTARIRGTVGSASGTLSLIVLPPACSPATVVGRLTIGQTASGSLARTDCILLEMEHADGWSFSVSQPTGVAIEMASSQFPPLLLVTDMAMNAVAYGGGGDHGARLVHNFAPGNYIVWASSWNLATGGSYSINAATVAMCSTATTAGTLSLDQTVTGELTANSCLLPHGLPGMGWRVSVPANSTVLVTMQATGFQPLLVATDRNMGAVAFGDAIRPGGPAQLVHRFGPGEHVIWATSAEGSVGTFSMSMSEHRLQSCTPPAGTISVGQTAAGTLGNGTCRLPDSRLADPWQLTLEAATSVRIDLTSSQFDTYLILADQEGRIIAIDDDGGDGLNSRLAIQLPAGGYTVWATSFSPFESGSYQLSVQQTTTGNTTSSYSMRPIAPQKLEWPNRQR